MIALFRKVGEPNSGKLSAVSVYYGMSYTHTHTRTRTRTRYDTIRYDTIRDAILTTDVKNVQIKI